MIPSSAYVVGVEVGPRQVVAASADITGRTTGRVEVSTHDADDPVGVVHAAVIEAADQAGAPWERVRRIVLGTPGLVDPATGDIAFAFDLPHWHHGLLDALRADLNRPVAFENDVNLAAIAEARVGAARDVEDFVLIWIGRGVGLAVVLGGRLHRGAAGAAGEIGYLPVPGGPIPTTPGSRHPRGVGAFQQTISAETVRALARAKGSARPPRPRRSRPRSAPGRRASRCSTSWPGGWPSASWRSASSSTRRWSCSPATSAVPAARRSPVGCRSRWPGSRRSSPGSWSTEVGATRSSRAHCSPPSRPPARRSSPPPWR